MKTIYLFFPVFLFAAFQGEAQLTLTKALNEPIAGDMYVMTSHDSTTAVPKSTGANQSWNFTSLTNSPFSEAISYINPASASGSSLFPTATLAAMRGTSDFEFFKATNPDWEFLGYYDGNSGDRMILSNPALFMKWPVS